MTNLNHSSEANQKQAVTIPCLECKGEGWVDATDKEYGDAIRTECPVCEGYPIDFAMVSEYARQIDRFHAEHRREIAALQSRLAKAEEDLAFMQRSRDTWHDMRMESEARAYQLEAALEKIAAMEHTKKTYSQTFPKLIGTAKAALQVAA